MSDELSPAHWSEARKLLAMNDAQLHRLRLVELQEGADLLRRISDLCRSRSRALIRFREGREAVGEADPEITSMPTG